MAHHNVAGILPILNRKVLDVNVPTTFGRYPRIDHLDGGFIILIDRSRAELLESKFLHNRTQVLGVLGSSNRG